MCRPATDKKLSVAPTELWQDARYHLARRVKLTKGNVMSVEFLRQIAATPLPKSFNAAQDIDAIKILRQAGLVLALVDEPPEGAARVLAITQKGRDELLRFHYPDARHVRGRARGNWLQLAAQRAREAIKPTGRRDGS